MKVENSRIQLNNTQKINHSVQSSANNNPTFTAGAVDVLRFLDTNQAWGANAVDFFCMVMPRTFTDFSRGPAAGFETARRESMGTINDFAVGMYGTLAGMALATTINRYYNFGKGSVKAGSIFADTETLEMMGNIWTNKIKAAQTSPKSNPLREFLYETIKNYEALSPDQKGQWVRFTDDKAINQVVDILEREIKADGKKLSKEGMHNAKSILLSQTGVENNFRIIAKDGNLHSSRYTLDSILENTYKLAKVFDKEKVKEAFLNSANVTDNQFIKTMKNMNTRRSILGVAIATLVGTMTQPINMWLTKRETGASGFVGGGEKDTSLKFKIEKLLVAGIFGLGVIATIGNPKNLLKNLQFKGKSPTINQLKFIYGATIMSRFLAARNENELKEASIKDILGFTNWLILGNFVQKLVAQGLDKTLIKQENPGGIINWISSSSLKSRDEVLHAALGKAAFGPDGKALEFGEMLKKLPKGSAGAKRLTYLTFAQLAGYLYSGLVLGFGIPKLNIYLTKRRMAKQEAEKNAQNNISDNMLNPANREFLNQKNFTGKNIFTK